MQVQLTESSRFVTERLYVSGMFLNATLNQYIVERVRIYMDNTVLIK